MSPRGVWADCFSIDTNMLYLEELTIASQECFLGDVKMWLRERLGRVHECRNIATEPHVI